MRAPKFPRRRFEHAPCERAAIQVIPQTFAGQFVRADAARARGISMEAIAIEHPETFDLPALPFIHFAPEMNRHTRETKIQVRRLSDLFAVAIAFFDHDNTPRAKLLRDRVDAYRFDCRRRSLCQTVRAEVL